MTTATTGKADARLNAGAAAHPVMPASAWAWIAVIAVLFVLFHRNFLWRMAQIATGDSSGDWSHALIVPVLAVYFVVKNHRDLLRRSADLFWPGMVLFVAGLFATAWAIHPGRNDMLQGYAMILSLLGLVLFLLGPRMLAAVWFPILYLGFGVKVSQRFWDQITATLQNVAAEAASFCLHFIGLFFDFDASNRGSTIELTFVRGGLVVTEALNIAEACAGLRMLMAFLALAAAIAFLTRGPWWQRLVLMLLAVPVAVAVNVGRVTVLGLLFMIDPQLAAGSFHTFVGMLMLGPAAALYLLILWVMDKLFVEDAASHGPPPVARLAPPSSATPAPEAARLIALGLAWGAGLMLWLGLTYALGLFALRPDLLHSALRHSPLSDLTPGRLTLIALLVVAALALPVIFFLARRWTLRLESRSGRLQMAAPAIASGVLLTAALGLNAAVFATSTVLIKQPVELRQALFFVPERLGPFQMVGSDEKLTAEVLEALGTRHYISRYYEDTALPEADPARLLKLHVAYYTGTPDTVPHVPDRCYVAGGIRTRSTAVTTLQLRGDHFRPTTPHGFETPSRLAPGKAILPRLDVPATLFTFYLPDPPGRQANVAYFFVANNKFLATPEQVRLLGFDPRDRYSYYCKVEVALFGVSDPDEAQRRASAFLSLAMPEIMACLPDWTVWGQGGPASPQPDQRPTENQPMDPSGG